ncbi:MAG: CPBP family intramembrane glutamic endopeptidase [Candidatus Thorarchaeota archaeon]|jgi:membrane protease YdiL (CAAX protease family)
MTEATIVGQEFVVETQQESTPTKPENNSRKRYYGVVFLYLLFFGVFLVLMSEVGNSSIPMALPFLFILLAYEAKRGRQPFEGIGLKKNRILREVGIGLVVGLVIAFVTYYSLIWGILSGQATGDTGNSFVFAEGFPFPINLALEIVYIFAFLTPAEEILFRGFIQGAVERRTSRPIAIFVQSAIFGLIHVGIMLPFLPIQFCLVYGFSAALIAVVFGIMYAWRDGNVIASWTSHGVVNSIAAAIVMVSLFMM